MIQVSFYAVALAMAALWLTLRIVAYVRTGEISIRKEFHIFLLFLYVLMIVRGVIFPMRSYDGGPVSVYVELPTMYPPRINIMPFTFITDYYPGWQVNVFGNIILFIPVGFLFPLVFRRINTFAKAVVFGLGFTCTIEFVQLFLRDRCTDVDDLILNTLGAAIGALVFFEIRKRKVSGYCSLR